MTSVRILLVEDSPSDAALFKSQLHTADGEFEVDWVPSFEQGRPLAASVDCVLLDLTLPDVQGLDAVDGLTATDPDMPVIVLTGFGDEQGGVEAVRRGAQDYLLKDDIGTRELSRAIRHAIERKSAQRDLLALAAKLEQRTRALALSNSTIFNDSYTAMAQLREDGVVLTANRAMTLLTGPSSDDLEGRSIADLFGDPHGELVGQAVADVYDTGIPQRRDALLLRDDGSTRLTALQLSRVAMDESDTEVVLMTVGDITSGSRAMLREANDQKLAELGRLAAGIAHEIRSPLQYITTSIDYARSSVQAIVAGTQHLSDIETRTDLVESLDEVADGIDRINEIVRGMNVLAHSGGTDVDLHNVNDTLDFPLTVVRGQAPPDTDFVVTRGDVPDAPMSLGRIQQVLLNLLVNSVHAIEERVASTTPRVTGRVEVETSHVGDWIQVRVADNGAGMAPDVLAHAMEPFFTTKPNGQGTGQGLAMVRDIVSQHDGSVTMESKPGEGTTTVILLPVSRR